MGPARGLIGFPGAMGLDWLAKPKGEADIARLVARKQYGQAIEALRARFARKLPDANQRLQLAGLLVLARRGEEAVPLLLGLADENVRRGFPDRALEMLDRIETIQPGRADVARRRASLQGEAAARAEWVEPVVLDHDEPFGASRPEEGSRPEEEPVTLPSLDTPFAEPAPARAEAVPPHVGPDDEDSLPEDEPVLADPDVSDPSTWARAIVEASFGPPEEERIAARSFEDGDTNPFGYRIPEMLVEANAGAEEVPETVPTPGPPSSRPNAAPPGKGEDGGRARAQERLRLAQELAARETSPAGRHSLASSLFAGHSRARLLALVPGLRRRTFSAGDVILTEGEPGESLFLIAHGAVKVFVRSPHGRSFEVGRLDENDFFGEVAVISGRPRMASVVAAAPSELLEVRRDVLETLLRGRPEAQALLEEACVARALHPAASAVRTLPKEASESRERAHAALAAHFGDTQWSLRMRLRLADLLLKAGNEGDAVAILTSVADALAAADSGEKALAVLQKIANIRRRHVEELCLAPLTKGRPRDRKAEPDERPARFVAAPEGVFRDWLVHMLRELTEEEGGPPLILH